MGDDEGGASQRMSPTDGVPDAPSSEPLERALAHNPDVVKGQRLLVASLACSTLSFVLSDHQLFATLTGAALVGSIGLVIRSARLRRSQE